MIKILLTPLLLILTFFPTSSNAQSILGRWYSKTMIDGVERHYLFDFRKAKDSYQGFVDLPGTNTFRVKLDSIGITDQQEIYLSHQGLGFTFTGRLNKALEEVQGTIQQDSFSSTLTLSRHPQVKRSQIIQEPIPYLSQDVFFYNADSTRLAGTITYPKTGENLKAVILITGSGPQNRDEEILGHKPFQIIADYLSRHGIVVFRYDDRGYGASEGQFRPATSLDYAYDAKAALQYLKDFKEVSIGPIGLAGHSEGGNIAPVVATMDSTVQFLILLAAPGTSNLDSYLISLDLILQDYPETYDRDYAFFKSVYEDMASIEDKSILTDSLTAKFHRIASIMNEEELVLYGGAEAYVKDNVRAHTSDWYHYYLRFDVTPYLKQLNIPILALNGDQDSSVEAEFNLKRIEETLSQSGHPSYETLVLPGVNHFFQVSPDDRIDRVYFNEETFSKVALEKMGRWILGLTKLPNGSQVD